MVVLVAIRPVALIDFRLAVRRAVVQRYKRVQDKNVQPREHTVVGGIRCRRSDSSLFPGWRWSPQSFSAAPRRSRRPSRLAFRPVASWYRGKRLLSISTIPIPPSIIVVSHRDRLRERIAIVSSVVAQYWILSRTSPLAQNPLSQWAYRECSSPTPHRLARQ